VGGNLPEAGSARRLQLRFEVGQWHARDGIGTGHDSTLPGLRRRRRPSRRNEWSGEDIRAGYLFVMGT
jgi:hypothetical protein